MSMPTFFDIQPLDNGPLVIINPLQIATIRAYRFCGYSTWELVMSNGVRYETRTNVEAVIFASEPEPKPEPAPAPKPAPAPEPKPDPVKVPEPTSRLARLEDKKPEVTKKPEIIDVSKDVAPEANMGRVVVTRRRRSVA